MCNPLPSATAILYSDRLPDTDQMCKKPGTHLYKAASWQRGTGTTKPLGKKKKKKKKKKNVYTFRAKQYIIGAQKPKPLNSLVMVRKCSAGLGRLPWPTWTSKMAKILDPILPILSIWGSWAIILGSFRGPGRLQIST